MTPLILLLLSFTVFLLLLLYRTYTVLPQRMGGPKPSTHHETPFRTLVVLGSGGHTGEMLRILPAFARADTHTFAFVVADTDPDSERRLADWWAENDMPGEPDLVRVPRSRSVGQSYLTSIFTTLYSFNVSLALTLAYHPDLLLCNGPGTCVPLAFAAWLYNLASLYSLHAQQRCHILYIESICRVNSLSLSAKILYHTVADRLVVFWPKLHSLYPRSVCYGPLF